MERNLILSVQVFLAQIFLKGIAAKTAGDTGSPSSQSYHQKKTLFPEAIGVFLAVLEQFAPNKLFRAFDKGRGLLNWCHTPPETVVTVLRILMSPAQNHLASEYVSKGRLQRFYYQTTLAGMSRISPVCNVSI